MAAVEKRKNGWVALLYNHLMFVVICALTLTLLKGAMQFILGSVFSFLYYMGIYEYCRKTAREHVSPYFETEFSWKFPLYYALIGNVYFWLGILANLIGSAVFPMGTPGNAVSLIIYIVWDSPFIFFSAFGGEKLNTLNLLPVVIFTTMFFVSSFLGYAMGKYEKSFRKFLGKFRKNKTVRKALR